MILAVFVTVIGQCAGVYPAHGGQKLPPFGFTVLGHCHLAAGDEQLAAFAGGDFGVMQLKRCVLRKPTAPLALAGDIVVKKTDARPPYAVGAVDGRLECDLQPKAACKADAAAKLRVCGGGGAAVVDFFTVRGGLHPGRGKDDPAAAGFGGHCGKAAASGAPAQYAAVREYGKIDSSKRVIEHSEATPLHEKYKSLFGF